MHVLGKMSRILLTCTIFYPYRVLAAGPPAKSLPDAPSAVASQSATLWDDSAPLPNGSGSTASQAPREDELPGSSRYWVKRILRDQAEIYTAPFHKSAVKWDVGLPLVTIAFVVADKHISGAVPKSPGPVSEDISNVGYYGMEGITGLILVRGLLTHNAHEEETGILGAESLIGEAGLYALLQISMGRDRPFQDARKGAFFQDHDIRGNSFPSGHAMFSWSAATILAREYPSGWVKWLAYGTATAVSVTRVTSGQHFAGDVVSGTALGYLIARRMFHLHCKPGLSAACSAK
jgi:membrane-associated phospholipid phosphatase